MSWPGSWLWYHPSQQYHTWHIPGIIACCGVNIERRTRPDRVGGYWRKLCAPTSLQWDPAFSSGCWNVWGWYEFSVILEYIRGSAADRATACSVSSLRCWRACVLLILGYYLWVNRNETLISIHIRIAQTARRTNKATHTKCHIIPVSSSSFW